MKDAILRFIYHRFSDQFNDYMVEEYLDKIPNNVTEPALTVINQHKRKMKKLNEYFAYHLHRRMANDSKNSERYQGMFIQLKMQDQIIEGRPDPEHEQQVKPTAEVKMPDYEEAINKAGGFVSKFRKNNPQE